MPVLHRCCQHTHTHSEGNTDVLHLGFFDTTKNVGLYSVAFRVVVLLLIIDRVFYNIFFPAVSRSFKDSQKHLKEGVIWTIKIVTKSYHQK